MKITAFDVDVMARTIYGEARGDTLSGQIAVAWVIKNRYLKKFRGDKSITAVCLHPEQFSCWNQWDTNRPILSAANLNEKAFRTAYYVACGVINDLLPRPFDADTLHFHTPSVDPSWSRGKNYVTIGLHRFFSGIR